MVSFSWRILVDVFFFWRLVKTFLQVFSCLQFSVTILFIESCGGSVVCVNLRLPRLLWRHVFSNRHIFYKCRGACVAIVVHRKHLCLCVVYVLDTSPTYAPLFLATGQSFGHLCRFRFFRSVCFQWGLHMGENFSDACLAFHYVWPTPWACSVPRCIFRIPFSGCFMPSWCNFGFMQPCCFVRFYCRFCTGENFSGPCHAFIYIGHTSCTRSVQAYIFRIFSCGFSMP